MNKEIHPEIKKYWEKFHGKEVIHYLPEEYKEFEWYGVQAEGYGVYVIAQRYLYQKLFNPCLPHLKDFDWVYYGFNKTVYDEATTLRIIKLKAFL